jgi:hypothetical protein
MHTLHASILTNLSKQKKPQLVDKADNYTLKICMQYIAKFNNSDWANDNRARERDLSSKKAKREC